MATIDDLLKLPLTDKKEQEALTKKGVKEHTNKTAIIQALIDAGKAGDVKASLYLLEHSANEKSKDAPQTPVDKARNSINAKKTGNRK